MKLTREQQVLLYGALFHSFSTKAFDPLDEYEELKSLMNSLRDELSSSDEELSEPVEENEDESSHDVHESVLTKDAIAALDQLRCGLRGEKKKTLSFEYNGDYLDAILEDEVFENVDRIVRSAKSIDFREAGGSWSNFDVEKFPKSWTELLELDVTYTIED